MCRRFGKRRMGRRPTRTERVAVSVLIFSFFAFEEPGQHHNSSVFGHCSENTVDLPVLGFAWGMVRWVGVQSSGVILGTVYSTLDPGEKGAVKGDEGCVQGCSDSLSWC